MVFLYEQNDKKKTGSGKHKMETFHSVDINLDSYEIKVKEEEYGKEN